MSPAKSSRSREVCVSCHRRKVKCDIRDGGVPCSGCKRLGEPCERRGRKAYDSSRRSAGRKSARDLTVTTSNAASTRSESLELQRDDGTEDSNTDAADETQRNLIAEILTSRVHAVGTRAGDDTEAETVPLFVGDKQGIGALLSVTNSDRHSVSNSRSSQHLMIPRSATIALAPEDLEYLKIKGCFSLPSIDICGELISKYFAFVHPTFPVLDAEIWLKRFEVGGVGRMNLLLLWSMFSVAASYVDGQVLLASGFATRRAWKESMVRKAKLLFDLSHENDKIVLIQSALLLGFWFVDAEDVMQSWYWTGIAIGIAQTIGLHRDPSSKGRSDGIGARQIELWRQLWWSCVMRDSWLAFGMGRPMRIDLKDCDCPVPEATVVTARTPDLSVAGQTIIDSDEAQVLMKIWHHLLTTTIALREVLRVRQQMAPPDIDLIQQRLAEPPITRSAHLSEKRPISVAAFHISLHQHAAHIALYRIDKRPEAREKMQVAANAINALLQQAMSDGTVAYAGPMAIALIVPAMHTHLLKTKSKDTLASQVAVHKLDLCLMFLKAVEDNYPGASLIQRLFRAAFPQPVVRSLDAQSLNTVRQRSEEVRPVDKPSESLAVPMAWDRSTSVSDSSVTGGFEMTPFEYSVWSTQMEGADQDMPMNFYFGDMLDFGGNGVQFGEV